MKLAEIQELIKFVARAGVNEVEIEQKDFKILIKSDYMAQKKSNIPAEPQIIQQQVPVVQQVPAAMAQPVVQQPAQTQTAAPVESTTKTESTDDANYITVKSQMIGTFYRSSSPDKPAFVEVGDSVKAGDPICIIEAMKLFNEIESEVSGKIVKVLVDDATPVEFDQPLFLVDPA